MSKLVLSPALAAMALLAGCHNVSVPTPQNEQTKAAAHAVAESERSQLAEIPPPSKSRFMAIHSMDSWQNPAVTIQQNMVELRVLLADPNPSDYGAGGMLRPSGARKQVLTVTYDKLGEAVAAIPQTAWPYGRVIAIEEAHKVPPAQQPAIRRAAERAMDILSDRGVVIYDPNDGTIR